MLAFCLMPNHFHFLIKQSIFDTIDQFLNSLGTRYSMYFNRKYKRIGPLYQGVYKAVIVSSDEQLLHLSRYIHHQALASQGDALEAKQPSSYSDYLGITHTPWVEAKEILSFFSKSNPKLSYQSFVKQNEDFALINKLALED